VVIVLPLGIGVVTGILLLNSYGKVFSRRRTIESGLILLGIFLAILSAAGPVTRFLQHVTSVSPIDVSSLVTLLSVVIVLAFLAGIAYASVAIPAQTQLQEDLPEEVRGRVFGVLNMLISTASFLPIIIVGPIADLLSTTAVVFVVALAIAASGILSAVARRNPVGA
jgi:MFS family permease